MSRDAPLILRTPRSWIDGEAEQQLRRVAGLEGMERVVGMPDLHPGKGSPVGAAFFSTTHVFPYLVGNDIGCGMGLWALDAKLKKVRLDKWEKHVRRAGLDRAWPGNAGEWMRAAGIEQPLFEENLGTIGGGNHFAEVLRAVDVVDAGRWERAGLRTDVPYLLVHSGSRGLGESILREFVDAHRDAGVEAGGEAARAYLARHDAAVAWARANRALIAHRFSEAWSVAPAKVLDLVHNAVVRARLAGSDGWLHRKGAAPAESGRLMPIPGSRGAPTYLVEALGDGERNAHSLAHGAGRKWKRSEARARLSRRHTQQSLGRTSLGSRVICDDKDLIFEEAPEAYKSIRDVVQALVDAGVARVVAVFEPLLTYKKASGRR